MPSLAESNAIRNAEPFLSIVNDHARCVQCLHVVAYHVPQFVLSDLVAIVDSVLATTTTAQPVDSAAVAVELRDYCIAMAESAAAAESDLWASHDAQLDSDVASDVESS